MGLPFASWIAIETDVRQSRCETILIRLEKQNEPASRVSLIDIRSIEPEPSRELRQWAGPSIEAASEDSATIALISPLMSRNRADNTVSRERIVCGTAVDDRSRDTTRGHGLGQFAGQSHRSGSGDKTDRRAGPVAR